MADSRPNAPGTTSSDSTSSSTTDACAPSSRTMNVRPTSVRAAPTAQRSTIGRSTRTLAGTWTTMPCDQAARDSWASFSSVGRIEPPSSSERANASSVRTSSASGSTRTPAARTSSSSATAATPSSRISNSAATSAGRRGGHRGGRGDRGVRRGILDPGGPEVEVRGVQAVALDLERLEQLERREPVVAQPRGLVALGDERVHERPVEERDRERGGRAARRAGRPRRGRRFGDLRHPSDPSISSFTSRLNSIAYSIGSSLVNTSRKPWTMRFVASFSVSPRAIR